MLAVLVSATFSATPSAQPLPVPSPPSGFRGIEPQPQTTLTPVAPYDVPPGFRGIEPVISGTDAPSLRSELTDPFCEDVEIPAEHTWSYCYNFTFGDYDFQPVYFCDNPRGVYVEGVGWKSVAEGRNGSSGCGTRDWNQILQIVAPGNWNAAPSTSRLRFARLRMKWVAGGWNTGLTSNWAWVRNSTFSSSGANWSRNEIIAALDGTNVLLEKTVNVLMNTTSWSSMVLAAACALCDESDVSNGYAIITGIVIAGTGPDPYIPPTPTPTPTPIDRGSILVDFDPNYFPERTLNACTANYTGQQKEHCWVHVSVLSLIDTLIANNIVLNHRALLEALIEGEFRSSSNVAGVVTWGTEAVARQFYGYCGSDGCQGAELYQFLRYFQPARDALLDDKYLQKLRNWDKGQQPGYPAFQGYVQTLEAIVSDILTPADPAWLGGIVNGEPFGFGTRGLFTSVDVSQSQVDIWAARCGFAVKTIGKGDPPMGQMFIGTIPETDGGVCSWSD